MLKWQEPLFWDDSIRGEEREGLKERCEKGKARGLFGYYLVTLSETPGNTMEILPCSAWLGQKGLRERTPLILGMAKGKASAIGLALKIVMEADCHIPRGR